jgi:hypothetical protein
MTSFGVPSHIYKANNMVRLQHDNFCSDSPAVMKTCTSCGLRDSTIEECFLDTSFGKIKSFDGCSKQLKECTYQVDEGVAKYDKQTFSDMVNHVYIISMHEATDMYHRVRRVSKNVEVFRALSGSATATKNSSLTVGELGIQASMVAVFQDALDKGHKTIAVFEDDALLTRNFEAKFSKLVASCACFLIPGSGCPPGVLMLGATVIGNEHIFNAWDHEVRDEKRQCANFIHGSWGAFANVYSAEVLPAMIEWVRRYGNKHPLDAIYPALATQGYVVRVARPYLSMALMNRTSTVQSSFKQGLFESPQARANWYYEKNRWNLSDFE